ncbi:RDD family protein [Sphaerotilus sp.]|uniref:RDD family protein n=1 Tax=Sphaerotilus sp. TaxID=2093942 RepID=UPI00286E1577|nr:RDD family protein [Sphaerotilus sp.]
MVSRSALPYTPDNADLAALPTPGLRRRVAAMLYEGVVLFGVLMIAGLLFSTLTDQRHALQGRVELQAFLFGMLGLYFAWFWIHSGQTVAMKTWHIRVVRRDGHPLGWMNALARYTLSWLWFLPALGVAAALKLHTSGEYALALLAGVVAYAALTRLLPDQQFLHDRLCQTRLVTWRPAPRHR